MKFSYSTLKKLLSEGLPKAQKFADEVAMRSFEIEEMEGDMVDIKITANRWSDAACHMGIAREAAAIFGLKENFPAIKELPKKTKQDPKIAIKDGTCSRYFGVLMEIEGASKSPSYMQKTLVTCGQRPINGVVDILNYVMLETGQPMHAFDADKVEGSIIVRKTKKGEKITTIDNKEIELRPTDTVIADEKKAIAIAGVKGGKNTEITAGTKRIIVESACFDAVSIYRTARDINLRTDASQRYGHGVSPETARIGALRAVALITEICGGHVLGYTDVYPKKQPKKIIKFDIARFVKMTGVALSKDKAFSILKKLGFKVSADGMVEVPPQRMDVVLFEDLVEEVIRIYGLDAVVSKAPVVPLVPPHSDEVYSYKERVKNAIAALGFDEVYSYSFGEDETSGIELMNPMSRDKRFMRASLLPGLMNVVLGNRRSFDEVRVFEIGKVFESLGKEHYSLGFAVRSKTDAQVFRTLKGVIAETMRSAGVVDIHFVPKTDRLSIEIDERECGTMKITEGGKTAYAEVNLDMMMASASQEFEYDPISQYPSVMRDISVWMPANGRVGSVMDVMEHAGAGDLADTDLIDHYEGDDGRISATFRLVFQSHKKTLSDAEVDTEMKKVISALNSVQGLEIR